MANDDLIRFFHFSNRNKCTLSQVVKETNKSEASIYLTLWRWSKRGLITIHGRARGSESNIFRSNSRPNNRRIYELTPSGRKYVEYKTKTRIQQAPKPFSTATIKKNETRNKIVKWDIQS